MHKSELQNTSEVARKMSLSEAEYSRIENALGRQPNLTELFLFAVLWSESCSLKSASKWLESLNNAGKGGFLENTTEQSGWLEIDRGIGCVLSMGAFNQIAALSPRLHANLGAASINRSILAMGASPFAVLNSLRLGSLTTDVTRQYLQETVQGVGEHCFGMGVPVVAGETFFHPDYQQHSLLNLLSLGLTKREQTIFPLTGNAGNIVMLAGAKTSKNLTPYPFSSNTDEPVAMADSSDVATTVVPSFSGKILQEAVLEAVNAGLITGMKSIEKGGLAMASADLCVVSGTGMVLNLDSLPTFGEGLQAHDLLLSDSPDRLVIILGPNQEEAFQEIFEKWEIAAAKIGEVTDNGRLEIDYQEEKVVDLPAELLVRGYGAPFQEQASSKPSYFNEIRRFNLNRIKSPVNMVETAKKLFASPNLGSKRWVFEQYDSMVRNNNLGTNAPADAAVLRMEGSDKLLALTVDGNAAYVFADPYIGGMIAVAEAARNITCAGGVPKALSYCLNFGNERNPEYYYQFINSIRGIAEACRKVDVPVFPGQVSFGEDEATEGKEQPSILPTPVIGMLGVIEDPEFHTSLDFKEEGDLIYMLGNLSNDLGSSEYLSGVMNIKYSPPPEFDLYEEFELQKHIRKLIRRKIVRSAHDVSEGGLFTNLMESAIAGEKGFNVETVDTFRKDCFLFGEGQSRIVITITPEQEDTLQNYLINNNVSFSKLGEVFGDVAIIDEENFGSISVWKRISEGALSEKMEETNVTSEAA